MTIELITGTPGAGKTTYAVATRIAKEVGREIKLDDETCVYLGLDPGTTVKRRVVQAGIRGLLVEHERLPHILTRDATSPAEVAKWNAMQTEPVDGKPVDSDNPVHQRLPRDPARLDVPAIMQNWWLWCQPGDLIVIDEAQFVMPRGSLGRKPPYWLQCMEIHRHYGVDFIIITQHPQLIDTTVRALVGLHRHVRAVMGSALCMVYVWDHAANPERFNLANKTQFLRRAKHYRLFHSSAAHVKPPTSGRSIMVVVPVLGLLVAMGFMHFKQRFSPPISEAVAATNNQAGGLPLPRPVSRSPATVPAVRGCIAQGSQCRCIGDEGRPLVLDPQSCRVASSSFDGFVKWEPSKSVRYIDQAASAPGSAPSAPARSPVKLL